MRFNTIDTLIQSLTDFEAITPQRVADLQKTSQAFVEMYKKQSSLDIIVICTHNSRRSHLGQVLFALASDYYNIPNVNVYSGGVEETAFNHRMVKALQHYGFEVLTNSSNTKNPIYEVRWGDDSHQTLKGIFSKIYNHALNPSENFAAILVCDSADQKCPMVLGASKRIVLNYTDPKKSDDTPQESQVYLDKVLEMGREFFFVMNEMKQNISLTQH